LPPNGFRRRVVSSPSSESSASDSLARSSSFCLASSASSWIRSA
jgi:hypothetical protein